MKNQSDRAYRYCVTLFAGLFGAGMLFSGVLVMQSTDGSGPDRPSFPERVVSKYSETPLTYAGKTGMAQYYNRVDERQTVEQWAEGEKRRDVFYHSIVPILERRCMHCHGEGTTMGNVSLRNLGDLKPLLGKGRPFKKLLTQTHIHLFGIGVLLLVLSLLWQKTKYSPSLKLIGTVVPPVALALDIGGWWLAKLHPVFAGLIIFGGGSLSLSILLKCLLLMIDVWRPASIRPLSRRSRRAQ